MTIKTSAVRRHAVPANLAVSRTGPRKASEESPPRTSASTERDNHHLRQRRLPAKRRRRSYRTTLVRLATTLVRFLRPLRSAVARQAPGKAELTLHWGQTGSTCTRANVRPGRQTLVPFTEWRYAATDVGADRPRARASRCHSRLRDCPRRNNNVLPSGIQDQSPDKTHSTRDARQSRFRRRDARRGFPGRHLRILYAMPRTIRRPNRAGGSCLRMSAGWSRRVTNRAPRRCGLPGSRRGGDGHRAIYAATDMGAGDTAAAPPCRSCQTDANERSGSGKTPPDA